ncbi:hypothetical protein K474DRAFT_846399 [Panus rudis PR-1116 ss-1]|nr:hypothetical protein K474DRAFT_846399 [Panus rudis PR-1116 ss-1]
MCFARSLARSPRCGLDFSLKLPALVLTMDEIMTSTLQYIVHLNVTEIDDLQARARTDPNDTQLTDEELAMLLFVQDAESLLNRTREHKRTRDDSDSLLEEFFDWEETARFDHELAIALSEGRPPPVRANVSRRPARPAQEPANSQTIAVEQPIQSSEMVIPLDSVEYDDSDEDLNDRSSVSPPALDSPTHQIPDLSLAEANGTLLFPPTGNSSALPDNEQFVARPDSSTGVLEKEKNTQDSDLLTTDCTICRDAIVDAIYAPCRHAYDVKCLEAMFRQAANDEESFPPRCCNQEMSVDDFGSFLDADLLDTFLRKAVEYRTKDRVYCSRKQCSAFIGAATALPTSVRCRVCRSQTCGACKGEAHGENEECHGSDATIFDLAKTQGWQRCPSCRHMVERTQGCPHIICRCAAEFCYLCGELWGACRHR